MSENAVCPRFVTWDESKTISSLKFTTPMVKLNHDKIEKILSERSKEIILFNGNSYNMHKNIKNGIVWRCRDRSCKGVIILNYENNIIKETPHSHLQDFALNENMYLKDLMKKDL
ncbi:hypothetical protein DMUE_5385 [Dictyocoela muelleri]|nr:hypothetical protein DMUE_5385 [Dictyocoela muelleri]